MAIDPYSLCPCASGKKLKFCCGANIGGDLDKIFHKIEAEQRVAALEHVNRTIEKSGPLDCLLSIKIGLGLELGEIENAKETATQYLKQSPNSADALAYCALLAVIETDATRGVEYLHRALDVDVETVPQSTFDTLHALARALMVEPEYRSLFAALGHIRLLGSFADENDDSVLQLLNAVDQSPTTPVLFKQFRALTDAAEGQEWLTELNEALDLANDARWTRAVNKLVALDKKHPHQAVILRNLAILQGWLLKSEEAVASWRKLAKLKELPLDDAVEAEAMAQLLDNAVESEMIDELRLEYTIKDVDGLMERLLSHELVTTMPIDPATLEIEGEPPPRAAFWLMDKPMPEVDSLSAETIPSIVGEMVLFGKQTDREARVYLKVHRTEDFWLKTTAAAEVMGQFASSSPTETVLGQSPAESTILISRWVFPEETPPEVRESMVAEQRREALFNRWPDIPRGVLQGKSPRDAVADESTRLPLLALLLLYETQASGGSEVSINELRKQLGLPEREELVIPASEADDLPLVRIPYMKLDDVGNENLRKALIRSVATNFYPAVKVVVAELLRREDRGDELLDHHLHGLLARTAPDSSEMLEHLEEAKRLAEAANQSPAPYLLRELDIRIRRMEAPKCQELIQLIQSRHAREEGVATGLYQILLKYGLIRPDGSPATPGAGPPGAPMPERAGAERPGADAESPFWTPDSAGSPTEQDAGEGKSKLWVPGMD